VFVIFVANLRVLVNRSEGSTKTPKLATKITKLRRVLQEFMRFVTSLGRCLQCLDVFRFFRVFLPYVELIPGSDFSATISKILARTMIFEKRPGSGREVLCAQKCPGHTTSQIRSYGHFTVQKFGRSLMYIQSKILLALCTFYVKRHQSPDPNQVSHIINISAPPAWAKPDALTRRRPSSGVDALRAVAPSCSHPTIDPLGATSSPPPQATRCSPPLWRPPHDRQLSPCCCRRHARPRRSPHC
jgi:hypothetical protein